mgnify:CR=1 FL=1
MSRRPSSPTPRRLRWAATASVAVLALGSLGACSDDGNDEADAITTAPADATTTTALEPFVGDDFYATPELLPDGEHGTLVRFAAADDVEVPGGTAYRIMYLSESLEGDPIVVTGIASVPTDEERAIVREAERSERARRFVDGRDPHRTRL